MASQKEITTYPEIGGAAPRERIYHGTLTLTGASGAIGSTDIQGAALTVVKNAAAGRYDWTLHRGFGKIKNVIPSLEGPASSSFGNTTANACANRSVNASAGTFTTQLLLASTGVDTDGASGYVVRVTVVVTDYTGP
jgi:hypothetical protein